MAHKTNPCGNPECGCSTGIHAAVTHGWGVLDEWGFWEYPCRLCAAAADARQPETRQRYFAELVEANSRKPWWDRQTYSELWTFMRRNHEWLFEPHWPYARKVEVECSTS